MTHDEMRFLEQMHNPEGAQKVLDRLDRAGLHDERDQLATILNGGNNDDR